MIISIKQVRNFIISILIPLAVGFASSAISRLLGGLGSSQGYSELIKPSFAPPGFIFPIAWTILYILMGISAYLIFREGYDKVKVRDALFYYGLQLFLNFLWSILFFGLGLRLTALIDIILMILISLIMISKFYKINKLAAYLNIPYILWLSYAAYLNYFVWIINK